MDYFDPNAGYYPAFTSGGFNAYLDQISSPEHVAFDLGALETSPYDWGLSQQQGYTSGSQDGIRPQGAFGKHDYNPVQAHGLTYIYLSIFGGLAWGVDRRLWPDVVPTARLVHNRGIYSALLYRDRKSGLFTSRRYDIGGTSGELRPQLV